MRRNSMLTFLKEKSFIIVLALMVVSAGTMAFLSSRGSETEQKSNELADASDGMKVSEIDLLEKDVLPSVEQKLPEPKLAEPEMTEQAALAPELEDQYVDAPISEEVSASDVVAEDFQEVQELSLQWPVDGEIVMEFSMDHSVYFQTLAQYQYNPAMILRAAQGTEVFCASSGTVIETGTSNEYGNYVTMDLGNGFALTYGQLSDVTTEVGEILEKGERIGVIAAPSRSYSLEGENLYLKLTKDGTPVNPELYLEN